MDNLRAFIKKNRRKERKHITHIFIYHTSVPITRTSPAWIDVRAGVKSVRDGQRGREVSG